MEPLWIDGPTVWVNPPQKTTAKQLLGPMFIRGPPPVRWTINHHMADIKHTRRKYYAVEFILPLLIIEGKLAAKN